MNSTSRRAFAVTSAALLALTLAVPAVAQDGEADHLQRIKDAGRIVMSTDALYEPQSFIDPDTGEVVGFDIDVGSEIAARLGVTFVPYPTAWAVVSSGRWADRWDFSVGSMTITVPRIENIDFTRPYYLNPAWLSAHTDVGATSAADLEGQVICVGEATTYFDWMNGTLDMGERTAELIPEGSVPPEGATVVTRPTDTDCASEWGSGRFQFQGWITSKDTTEAAIENGLPVDVIGPVFFEPLAVAFDNSVEDNDSLVAAVDQILADMHSDGTLSELSLKWFEEDLTQVTGE